jgi:hypothetical protein
MDTQFKIAVVVSCSKNVRRVLLSQAAGHLTKTLASESMKIKCYRFPCEVCGNGTVVSSIQVFFRKNGSISYARARHVRADKKFYYHQQSVDYTNRKLRELGIDLGQDSKAVSIEQDNLELSSKLELVAGPMVSENI